MTPIPAETHHIVGLSAQFDQLHPTAVMCDNTAYVLFRNRENSLCALADQCAHRRAPLSLGKLTKQGWIECPYHGWRFDGATGLCQAIPNLSAHEAVPRYAVPQFAVGESQGFVILASAGKLVTESLQLPKLADADYNSQGHQLLTYPHQALTSLLLDKPSSVIRINGVALIDSIRYGEPTVDAVSVSSHSAALWSKTGRPPKILPADYPLSVRIQVAHNGAWALIELLDELETVLTSTLIGFCVVKPTLTQTFWQSRSNSGAAPQITVQKQLDAEAIKTSHNYVSGFRKAYMASEV